MQVLMIDTSPLFKDFLKNKLTSEKINVDLIQGRRDVFTKILSLLPDLVIIETDNDLTGIFELLEKKHENPNTTNIPTFIIGPAVKSDTLLELMHLGTTKYFSKPFFFDTLCDSISKMFKVQLPMDYTTSILETHINGNLIFVEISQGMNREKCALLKYELTNLVQTNKMTSIKLVLMLSDLPLSFVDGINLEQLLNSITSVPNLQKTDIKILTLDSYTKELIEGHPEYKGIQVDSNIFLFLNNIVDSSTSQDLLTIITEKILNKDKKPQSTLVDLRFNSDIETRKTFLANL